MLLVGKADGAVCLLRRVEAPKAALEIAGMGQAEMRVDALQVVVECGIFRFIYIYGDATLNIMTWNYTQIAVT